MQNTKIFLLSAKIFIAETINGSKELVEFSALIAQYLKFYYVI